MKILTALFAIVALAACAPTSRTTLDGDTTLDGPHVVKNATRLAPDNWDYLANGDPSYLEAAPEEMKWATAGPITGFVLSDGTRAVSYGSHKDSIIEGLRVSVDPDTGAIDFQVDRIDASASAVITAISSTFETLYGEAFTQLSADRKEALITTAQEAVQAGTAVTSAVIEAWTTIQTGGASAILGD